MEIPVPGLTTDDLPVVQLYRGRRTTAAPISPPFDAFNNAFLPHPPVFTGDVTTALLIGDGIILIQYRRDIFDLNGDLFEKRFGLDGDGGTGEFRLGLIK